MNYQYKAAILLISLIPFIYIFGVLSYAFVVWESPSWGFSEWAEEMRFCFVLASVVCVGYSSLAFIAGKIEDKT